MGRPLVLLSLLATLASACARSQQAYPVLSEEPARQASSCVDDAPQRETSIEIHQLVTIDRGVRWFRAWDRGFEGLTWLRADGELGFHPLTTVAQLKSEDFAGWRVCAAEGAGAIRCFNGPMRRSKDDTWTPLWSVRVELSDSPQSGPLEHWEGAAHSTVEVAASNGEAVLLVHDDVRHAEPQYAAKPFDEPVSEAAVLTLWDVPEQRPSAHDVVRIEGRFQALAAWCEGSCSVVGRHRDFTARHNVVPDDPPARAVVITMPGGRVRTLAKDVDELEVFRSGRSWIVASRSHSRRSLKLVALDPEGSIRGRSRLGISVTAQSMGLGDGLFGFRHGFDHDWQVLAVSPSARVRGRSSIDGDPVGIKAARVANGIVVAALTGHTSYDDSGRYAFHNWSFEAVYRYLHAQESTSWRSMLGGAAPSVGEGRGGYDMEWLVRPDRAAILLWSTGDAWASPQLIPVRGPCTPS